MRNIKYYFLLVFLIYANNVFSKGYVDNYSVAMVTGWACDVRFPNDIVAVHIWRDDNQFLGGSSANIVREPAVGSACLGSHSAHGFSIPINLTEDLKDGQEHRVLVYSIGRNGFVEQLNNSPVKIKFPGDGIKERPYYVGDIVARNLDWPVIEGAGHIGIWDGTSVIEVLNEPQAVQKNNYENFFKRSKVWPISRTKWPDHNVVSCFSSACTEDFDRPRANKKSYPALYAMIARANQIYAIGAIYVVTPYVTPAEPTVNIPPSRDWNKYVTWPPKKGRYRCDTFITDIMGATVRSPGSHAHSHIQGQWLPLRIIDANIATWYQKYISAAGANIKAPAALYNKLKQWQ